MTKGSDLLVAALLDIANQTYEAGSAHVGLRRRGLLAASPGEAWPERPVRYINGFPPGGPTDTLSRIWCAKMLQAHPR